MQANQTSRDIGCHLYLLNIEFIWLGTQFHSTYDAIPISLCLVSHAMRVLPHTDILDAIVDLDSDGVALPWHNQWGDVILMGGG